MSSISIQEKSNLEQSISTKLQVEVWQVSNVIELMNEGSTIPFIARYRKEKTGGLSDLQISEIQKLMQDLIKLGERKEVILRSIEEQGLMTEELRSGITHADSISLLEDLYLPFKPKRKTRASVARKKGLEPLAKMIMSENIVDPEKVADRFVNADKAVLNVRDALQGARDIIAEWINEREQVRRKLRRLFENRAMIQSRVIKDKKPDGEKFTSYFDWQEKAGNAPSHRVLAIFRGETEGVLKVTIVPDFEEAVQHVEKLLLKGNSKAAAQKKLAIRDSTKRLLFPSLENELRGNLKKRADEEAVRVFSDNLTQLLMAAPLGEKNVLAIDPGFRTGCKIVCLDKTGKLVNNDTIFPHAPQKETGKAVKKIKYLVNAYKIEAIAIGNGTAGRETEELIRHIRFDRDLVAVMVNESGASVYSASPAAREEFPEYDVTVRGAVSIGRRLMDPLAELVKIDPKAIGVGQYQHDVDQKLLMDSLRQTVEFCVNRVGVDLNTASKELLTYVSGIGPKLATEIINYRNEKGLFAVREDLKKVKGMGIKAFQQSAGFLRIKQGDNPLDASAVHPENYLLVEQMAKSLGCTVNELVGNREMIAKLDLQRFTDETTGMATLEDITAELLKPGRDPRKKFRFFSFKKDIKRIQDIKEGMVLPAIVTNITDFGAFVDLGVHESGLIHKSQIAEEYVQKPSDFLRLNQQLTVKVLQVDYERKRIGLTLIGVEEEQV